MEHLVEMSRMLIPQTLSPKNLNLVSSKQSHSVCIPQKAYSGCRADLSSPSSKDKTCFWGNSSRESRRRRKRSNNGNGSSSGNSNTDVNSNLLLTLAGPHEVSNIQYQCRRQIARGTAVSSFVATCHLGIAES